MNGKIRVGPERRELGMVFEARKFARSASMKCSRAYGWKISVRPTPLGFRAVSSSESRLPALLWHSHWRS